MLSSLDPDAQYIYTYHTALAYPQGFPGVQWEYDCEQALAEDETSWHTLLCHVLVFQTALSHPCCRVRWLHAELCKLRCCSLVLTSHPTNFACQLPRWKESKTCVVPYTPFLLNNIPEKLDFG